MSGLILGAFIGFGKAIVNEFFGNEAADRAREEIRERSSNATRQIIEQRKQQIFQGSRFSAGGSFVEETLQHAQIALNEINAAENRALKDIDEQFGFFKTLSRLLLGTVSGAITGAGGIDRFTDEAINIFKKNKVGVNNISSTIGENPTSKKLSHVRTSDSTNYSIGRQLQKSISDSHGLGEANHSFWSRTKKFFSNIFTVGGAEIANQPSYITG